MEKQLVCAYLTFILLLAVAPSATSSEYQKYVLKTLRLLKDTSAAYLIEKLGESSTVIEKLTYQVISFIQKYIYRGKTNAELVETRMRQYNTMKNKATQTILPEPRNLREHIKKANLQGCYWRYYLEHNITKVDPCRAGWLRYEINGFK